MATTETIQREPQREGTGVTAVPTPTDNIAAYPGGDASKQIIVVASPIFQPARSVKRHENRVIDRKYGGYTQDFDSCIAVAVPRVVFWGPSNPDSDSFLACAAQNFNDAGGGAHAATHAFALVYLVGVCQLGLPAALFRFLKYLNKCTGSW